MRQSIIQAKRIGALAAFLSLGALLRSRGSWKGRYHISIAGLHIGTAVFSGTLAGQTYNASLNAQLIGLAGAMTLGRGAVAHGGIRRLPG